jgi:hypothetical protein
VRTSLISRNSQSLDQDLPLFQHLANADSLSLLSFALVDSSLLRVGDMDSVGNLLLRKGEFGGLPSRFQLEVVELSDRCEI